MFPLCSVCVVTIRGKLTLRGNVRIGTFSLVDKKGLGKYVTASELTSSVEAVSRLSRVSLVFWCLEALALPLIG